MAQAASLTESHDILIKRPPTNYEQHWDYEFFKTLKNEYTGVAYVKEAAALRDEVRHLLDHLYVEKDPIALLEFIEDIQRLGLGYVFKDDIRQVLDFLDQNAVENSVQNKGNLYATALYFRLFRQHGFIVSQDIFNVFKDPQGCFMQDLGQDIHGILSLYEASHLAAQGEELLDEAKTFARRLLLDIKQDIDPNLANQVTRALGLPLHYNIARLEARWYIDAYSKRKDANANLLRYAKLEYNMLQGTYREELAIDAAWCNDLGLKEKLPFTRDCVVQAFSWATGMHDEPQYSYCRKELTKLLYLFSVIDDVYDSYATLDEAKLFTDVLDRWDVNEVEQLPEYMKLLFFAFYNTINGFAYVAMKEQGVNVLPYLRKKAMDNIKAYLVELNWVKTGYVPSFKEYMEVACASSTVALIYYYSYVFMSPKISVETLDYMDSNPDIIHWSNFILRLLDDLNTYQDEFKRGDNVKAIECYMNDEGVTEEVAQIYIHDLTQETWKKLNAEMLVNSALPNATAMMILNTNRVTQVFYQYGDGYGHPGREMKKRFSTLVFDSIPM